MASPLKLLGCGFYKASGNTDRTHQDFVACNDRFDIRKLVYAHRDKGRDYRGDSVGVAIPEEVSGF